MSEYLGAFYTVVGFMVALAASIWLIIGGLFILPQLIEMYQHRKDERLKEFILGQLEQYNRLCGDEFPQIAELCEVLENKINNGWWSGQHDSFRENLRKKYKSEKPC